MSPSRPATPPTRRGWIPGLVVAVVAYVPLLLTEPGVVVADTKTYLYLDPSRLLSRAWSMWDPSVGMGTVPHQNIGYLWPMGPWYWVFDKLGAPDWVAQRLWLGTIIALAAYGVVWMLRTLGWRGPEPWAAALLYALTPYLLTVAARLSVLLLPFAALPWMIGLVVRALRDGGWRWPAVFALVVTTAGSVNLTALVLAGVGPVLWMVYAVLTHEVTLRRAAAAVGRIGVLTVPVCAWWLAGLWVQGGWGINVLRFTETAKVVAQTSTANEVLRGLGYWFFYGGDRLGPWIEPGVDYTQRLGLIALSYAIPIAALVAMSLARWRHRAFFASLIAVGTLLAVGAHPWDDPTLFGRGAQAFLKSDKGLALRSLPRAIPLVALGLAVALGAGAVALARRAPRARWAAVIALMAVAVANLPTLWLRQTVPANLQRPEEVPAYWTEAAAALDAGDHSTRVLEIPGADFASYRWGNTVDPITPGLMDRPYVARELIPYGTPASSDLLIALDHRLQEGILDPGALAVMARLMNAGDVVVRSDLQYERFNTPRPRNLYHEVASDPGLGPPTPFGPPSPNVAVAGATLDDELLLQTPPTWPDPAPVSVFPVDGAQPILRAVDAGAPVVVAGDGEGLVDAAGAGLIDGTELIRYSATAAGDPDALQLAVGTDAALLVTDSNRKRGRRWTTVRHNTGATEEAGTTPLVTDLTDNQLPVFPAGDDSTMTVAEHRGGVHAQATSYGNPITFTPEERAANAVDGDPATAWRTAAFGDAVGQRLELRFDQPRATDHLTLVQPQTGEINRTISSVRMRFDDGPAVIADLDDTSSSPGGETLSFSARTFSKLSIEITGDTGGTRPRYDGLTSEGFAEVRVGDDAPVLDEVIRVPTDLLDTLGPDSARRPLTFLLTRQRITASDPTRADEERSLARSFQVPTARDFTLSGLARLSPLADDATLDRLLGVTPADGSLVATSSLRLPGDRGSRASATIDGDPATAWIGRFGNQQGQWLAYHSAEPVTADHLSLTVLADGLHSVPTELALTVDGVPAGTVTVPPIADQSGQGSTGTVTVALPAPLSGSDWKLTVAAVRDVQTISWSSGEPVTMPVGIAEVGLGGLALPAPTGLVDSGCRDDLVTVDGLPVEVDISGSVADALAGLPLPLRPCGASVSTSPGEHVLRTRPGATTGLDIDQLSLRSAADGGLSAALGTLADEARSGSAHPDNAVQPIVRVSNDAPDAFDAFVVGARVGQPFWLVLGQSASSGWTASVDGKDLGEPTLVNGYANGWLINPTTQAMRVHVGFAPQKVVNRALAVSAVAALVCLALALSRRGRPKPWEVPAAIRLTDGNADDGDLEPRPLSWSALTSYEGVPPPVPSRVLTVAALALGSFVVAGPVVALVTGALSAGALAWRRGRWLVALGSPAALAVAAAYVITWQIRFRIAPGLEWPGELERAHPLGWLAVTLLVADVTIARRHRGGREHRRRRRRGVRGAEAPPEPPDESLDPASPVER
ncbi:MAG: alpha-(1-_3)-arabinofuranosyltransferase family protein [Acidimicrobiales bacterium]